MIAIERDIEPEGDNGIIRRQIIGTQKVLPLSSMVALKTIQRKEYRDLQQGRDTTTQRTTPALLYTFICSIA